MTILSNAVVSIQLGVEDFRSTDQRRLLSAVRNLYAGILLLFKHKLAELSPGADEALLKQRVVPVLTDGDLGWRGEGRTTVDVFEIQRRFKSLRIDVDWKLLQRIQNYRNEVEHYYATAQPDAVREYVAECTTVMRDFISKHLADAPQKLLGDETWTALVEAKEIVAKWRAVCAERLNALTWASTTARAWVDNATCRECGAGIIQPKGLPGGRADHAAYECLICTTGYDFDEVLELGAPDLYSETAEEVTQNVGCCISCGRMGYDAHADRCVYCDAQGPYSCVRCGNTIPVEEMDDENGMLCGWCLHMSTNND